MKKLLSLLLGLCLLCTLVVAETAAAETLITLGETVLVDGAAITEDTTAPVYLALVVEEHSDVPEDRIGLPNNVVTIAAAGTYRVTGTAENTQLAVRAGENDKVRIILDNVDITCRTAPGIAVFSGYDPKTPGEYGVVIELADNSYNVVHGSHTKKILDTDTKMDGAVDSLISLGFEGTNGRLDVEADNEGMEVKFGHMTINGGIYHINAADDPLNVSEDGVAVLTVNDGYLFSAVRNEEGGEGDGIDSNGWIIFNGGTAINLAHPASMDGGIDSDMGSSINGGVIVGAGNMYDEIEKTSEQLFMMLEFSESTDDLLVVTDKDGNPVFAYDFPYDYMYIAFSTPDLVEGETYHVYLAAKSSARRRTACTPKSFPTSLAVSCITVPALLSSAPTSPCPPPRTTAPASRPPLRATAPVRVPVSRLLPKVWKAWSRVPVSRLPLRATAPANRLPLRVWKAWSRALANRLRATALAKVPAAPLVCSLPPRLPPATSC